MDTYTLKDFEAIPFQQGILSENTIRIIQSLCSMIEPQTSDSSNHTASSRPRPQKEMEYNGEKHFKKKWAMGAQRNRD